MSAASVSIIRTAIDDGSTAIARPPQCAAGQTENAEMCTDVEQKHVLRAMGDKTEEFLPLPLIGNLRFIDHSVEFGMTGKKPLR